MNITRWRWYQSLCGLLRDRLLNKAPSFEGDCVIPIIVNCILKDQNMPFTIYHVTIH